MEAKKSHDFQLPSWRAKIVYGAVPVQKPAGSRLKNADVSVQVWRQEKTDAPAEGISSYSDFLPCSDLQVIGWSPLTLGTAICFTESTDADVNLTQSNAWANA